MQTIYKYPVSPCFVLRLPVAAEVLTVQVQRGEPVLWVLLDPDDHGPSCLRAFKAYPTGGQVEAGLTRRHYRRTFQTDEGYVFHLFELPMPPPQETYP